MYGNVTMKPVIVPNQKYANKKKFEFRSSREWPGYSEVRTEATTKLAN